MSIPYNYSKAEDGARIFKTDYGLKYRAYFLGAGGYFSTFPQFSHLVETFGFEIIENPNRDIPIDARVGATITFILLQFFEQNQDRVLFFIHDSSDGRESGRKKKFDAWFRRAGSDRLIKEDAAITIGRVTILCSILLLATHPSHTMILDGFRQLAFETGAKPEE